MLTPKRSSFQLSANPESKTAQGTLLMSWLNIMDMKYVAPPESSVLPITRLIDGMADMLPANIKKQTKVNSS
jgi:hypothetical protein